MQIFLKDILYIYILVFISLRYIKLYLHPWDILDIIYNFIGQNLYLPFKSSLFPYHIFHNFSIPWPLRE